MVLKKVVSILLIFISFLILISYRISYDYIKIKNNIMITDYNSINKKDYFGIINIKRININNIIYNINDRNNNVNKNILLLKDDKSLIVLAAHSGSSPISFFNKLANLNYDDEIIIERKKRLRFYRLFAKDYVKKTGKIVLESYNYPTLVLITCSKKYKNYQEVYYTRLIKSTKKL